MALENKIDETLTESISILKQVTLSLFNIRFTNFPQIKKLLDHVLWEGVIKNGYRMVRLTVRVDLANCPTRQSLLLSIGSLH